MSEKPTKKIEPLTPKEENEFRQNARPGNPFGGGEVARLIALLDVERARIVELEEEIKTLKAKKAN